MVHDGNRGGIRGKRLDISTRYISHSKTRSVLIRFVFIFKAQVAEGLKVYLFRTSSKRKKFRHRSCSKDLECVSDHKALWVIQSCKKNWFPQVISLEMENNTSRGETQATWKKTSWLSARSSSQIAVQSLTLSPLNKLSSAKFLVCLNFKSASMLLKTSETVVWVLNILHPGGTPKYSASHPHPSCLYMAL